jgi:hypothetical protein
MTTADHQLQRILAAALELDTPRPGEDAEAMILRVASELREHRQRQTRYFGFGWLHRLRGAP